MFCDKILYYVHMTLVTSMMKWCPIIYLKNEQCLEESWVVVKREIILKDVNGEFSLNQSISEDIIQLPAVLV